MPEKSGFVPETQPPSLPFPCFPNIRWKRNQLTPTALLCSPPLSQHSGIFYARLVQFITIKVVVPVQLGVPNMNVVLVKQDYKDYKTIRQSSLGGRNSIHLRFVNPSRSPGRLNISNISYLLRQSFRYKLKSDWVLAPVTFCFVNQLIHCIPIFPPEETQYYWGGNIAL